MSQMTKLTLTLTLNDPHNDAKYYSVSESWIDENNEQKMACFPPRIVTKLTSAAEYCPKFEENLNRH